MRIHLPIVAKFLNRLLSLHPRLLQIDTFGNSDFNVICSGNGRESSVIRWEDLRG